jgi:hypothetical protein
VISGFSLLKEHPAITRDPSSRSNNPREIFLFLMISRKLGGKDRYFHIPSKWYIKKSNVKKIPKKLDMYY